MTHALIGATPQGPWDPVQVNNLGHAQSILGRLDASPTLPLPPVLVALGNLFISGARGAVVLRTPSAPPSLDDILPHLTDLGRWPDLQSIAAPGLIDPDALLRLAAAIDAAQWSSRQPGGAQPTPILWADLPLDATPDDARHLVEASLGRVVPVLPSILTHAPGRLRAEPFPATTLAQAALTALPRPIGGLHDPQLELDLITRRSWTAAGAALLYRRRAGRPILTLSLPPALQSPGAPKPPTPLEVLHAELQKIVSEEEGGPHEGRDGRTVRRLRAALGRAFQRGILYGDAPDKAFQVRVLAPGDIEVNIRNPPRSPGGLQINFAFPKGPPQRS